MAEETRKFDLSLVTPDGPAFEGEVEMIVVPGAAGEIGVLARHAPLIATLKAGSTRVYLNRATDDIREFATGAGFFKVEEDRAIALVDDAVRQARSTTYAPGSSWKPLSVSSSSSIGASPTPIAGRSSSASSTPRTSSPCPAGTRRLLDFSSRKALKGSLATGLPNA